MEDNPFSALVNEVKSISRDQVPVVFRIGRVISVAPLRIEVGGIQIEKNEIYINKALTLNLTDKETGLSIGDSVVLLTEADTTFYLLCKVVRL